MAIPAPATLITSLRRNDVPTIALVALAALAFYLPCAGTYGLWDPWETHYGEVARQMTVRGDFISLWWPCSPRETPVFQTKPVLAYWLMSLSMHLFGIGEAAPGALALGTRGEWAVRAPSCVMAAIALASLYAVAARLLGRRAGLLAALCTATMPMFAQLGRQAMTDMPFLALMTPAIGLGALAFEWRGGDPRAAGVATPCPRAAWLTGALFVLACVPQLLVDSLQLRVRVPWFGGARTMYGALVMVPYWLGAAGVLLFVVRTARTGRKDVLALLAAATLAGLAVLAKGLAGLGMPVLIVLGYVAARGRWTRLRDRQLLAAIGVALVVVAVIAVPWHHAMYIRHGAPWWNELFGDNHWRRMVLGRHGDRGTFAYFLRELGYGAWPFVALIAPALLRALRPGTADASAERRQAALTLGVVWFAGAYAIVSLSMTKFHHYLLPALPGLGLLLGAWLDELMSRDRDRDASTLALAGLPLLAAVTYDYVATKDAPEKLLWLFSYDYVHARGGRPWPPELELRPALLALGVAFLAATTLLTLPRTRRMGAAALLTLAVAQTLYVLDVFMPRVATSWSQKGTIARYYRERRDPEEHLIAYYMFWRGETFYTANAIYEGPPEERTVFDYLADTDTRLRTFLGNHRGRRQFFLFEPSREGHLRSLLPADAAPSFRIIERSNNKFVLAVAEL
jgi:4-amino-4-deoxy-L-arabinose transferase-like glycosyltransferase